MGCRGVVFEIVALSDEALYFWCEVWVVSASVALGDMSSVCVDDYRVELVYGGVNVFNGSVV